MKNQQIDQILFKSSIIFNVFFYCYFLLSFLIFDYVDNNINLGVFFSIINGLLMLILPITIFALFALSVIYYLQRKVKRAPVNNKILIVTILNFVTSTLVVFLLFPPAKI